ncbi:MAG TPA: thioesterase family protein [Terriglobales bacterium]|nr:thioesterase family protein [Terriglobales bacterium]
MAERPFRLVHEIVPRFRDTDAMGHVNNAVYLTYLEVARQAYWERTGGLRDFRDIPFILARVECDFRSQARVHETLAVGIRCEWIGTKSFAFAYEIRETSTNRLVAEATSILVGYDYEKQRSIPVPESLRRSMEAFEGRNLARANHAS